MRNTCIHCGSWTGSTAVFKPKHREGCPLRKEPPVSAGERLAERLFMFDFIADATAAISKLAGPPKTPEENRAAMVEFFSDPHVQAAVRDQTAACARRGHDGHCPVCAPET